MIKYVFIDIDDTILDFCECAKLSMKEAFKAVSVPFEEEYFDIFTRINDSLWKRLEIGEITKDDLYVNRWETVFSIIGKKCDADLFEKEFLSSLDKSAQKTDGADDIVRYLHSKYKLCAATNGPENQQKNRIAAAGFTEFFDEIFVSGAIGFSKPDKRFFSVSLSALGDPDVSECVMIGDSLTADISGAVNIGMKSIWFDRGKSTAVPDIIPDFTVRSLEEIKNIL